MKVHRRRDSKLFEIIHLLKHAFTCFWGPNAFNSFFEGSYVQAISLDVQVIYFEEHLVMRTVHVFQNFYENCKEYEESLN